MKIKAKLSKPYAKYIGKKIEKWKSNPIFAQERVFNYLVTKGKNTSFGKDHQFDLISDYDSFKKQVPIQDYEGLKTYMDRITKGEENVSWPGKPIYLSKTSGTTSGVKYIPITKDSMPYHLNAAKYCFLSYIDETGDTSYVEGKMLFLQGSPVLDKKNGILTGRLSGIVAHHVPAYLLNNRLPSLETNSIEDWEEKVETIIDETINEDMRLIGGIPSWIQMYFERILERTGKSNILEVFPNLKIYVHAGVNFAPYIPKFNSLIGDTIPRLEFYPASEGFIAFQDRQKEDLLLYLDGGIFYEFIPATEFYNENPTRISLKDVELGINYVLILNTNAGLWGYNLGDTVKFTSLKPYRIKVTGRIKHFTSAFGEHVIAEEIEDCICEAIEKFDCAIAEFHLAPQIGPKEGLPYHEWFIDFDKKPSNIDEFASFIDESLQKKNTYYFDLIEGNILRPCIITCVKKGSFAEYMKSEGKFGGQNKVPRLANDRKIGDFLSGCKV